MTELAAVTRLEVPRSVLTEGYESMRSAGKAKLEGMVLWAGRQAGTTFLVTRLIVPRQRGLSTPDGLSAVVDHDELHRLNVFLYREQLVLVAQVHTHPGRAYHSETDDHYAIATTVGSFSLVVPNFAVRDYPLSDCAVYRLQESGEWLEIDESIPGNQIVVLER